MVKHLGLSTFLYGLLTATATVLLALASLLAAPLSERFGKVPVIVVCHLCALPFLVLMGAIPVLPVVCARLSHPRRPGEYSWPGAAIVPDGGGA